MAEEMKKNEVLEEKNEETKDLEQKDNAEEGKDLPAAQNDEGEKKENFIQKGWNGLKKFGNEKVKPVAKKAAPWIGGAAIGAGILAGALLKKGLDDARKEADEDDDDLEDGFDVIDTDATVVDEETSNEE